MIICNYCEQVYKNNHELELATETFDGGEDGYQYYICPKCKREDFDEYFDTEHLTQ